jgi:hypothetical protein
LGSPAADDKTMASGSCAAFVDLYTQVLLMCVHELMLHVVEASAATANHGVGVAIVAQPAAW